jgi:hypothetical protein
MAIAASGYAANLEIDDQCAPKEQEVTFSVSVSNAPNDVVAFGIDILFDPTVLDFQGFEKGTLIQNGFSLFDVNEVSAGRLRVGGLEFGNNKIKTGSSGILVKLTFLVIDEKYAKMIPADLKDDVKNWTIENGKFCNNPPIAVSFPVSTSEGFAIDILLQATDPDGDDLTYSIVTPPADGILSGSLPNLIYTPESCFVGSDSFTYKANDGNLDSNIAEFTITVNDIPIILSANVTGNTLFLSWDSLPCADGYYLHYAPFPENDPKGVIDMKNQTSFSGELFPGAAYYVSVQGYNRSGPMKLSNIESFMIPPVLPAPTLSKSTTGNTVFLTWTEIQGASGYILYYAPYPFASPILSADMGNVTSFFAMLPAGSAYYIAIQAYDARGRSNFSNVESFTIGN